MRFLKSAEASRSAWLTRIPIAHRGLHGDGIIENTLAAFEAAAQAGYAIELDVRASADGEAFVFHDVRLERLTKGSGLVAAQSGAALKALAIPTLADVLALVRGRVPLFIEVKAEGKPDPRLLARLRHLLRVYGGPKAILSFSPRILGWFARHAPEIPRGLNVAHAKGLLTAARLAPHFIGYDIRALPLPGAGAARGLRVPILAWTVRDKKTWSTARAYADNIIFEGIRPERHG